MNAIGDVKREGARATALKFEIGARTLFAVRRALQRVPLSLAEARSGTLPALPTLASDADGYAITSLPEALVEEVAAAAGGMLPFVRQRYTRYYLDFAPGFETWFAALSSNTRQSLRRKAKKIAEASGGALDVRAYRTPAELEVFHPVARQIALRTYQERLLGSGLPDTPEFLAEMLALAAVDQIRAWLLYIGGEPAAYLYCPAAGDTLLYAYVGHDPAFNDWSPGAVLQLHALQHIFGERRFAHFDFTEGEGQHKRQLASGGVACVDLLLLRPSLANRAIMAALGGFNRAVAGAKRVVQRAGLGGLAKRLRRG